MKSGLNDLIKEYLNQKDWRVNENSNMSYSLQGLNYYLYSSLIARYWLEEIYPPEIAKAHQNGDFHIHDLGSLSVYCVGWDLESLLLKGFRGVEGKIASKPAKHFRTALGQIVNFMFTLQGEAAGAIAFSNFDTFLAPFIAYDDLTYNEVKQAIQEFIFNLNIPTRTGFQTPFTNLSFDLVVPNDLKDKKVIIGGERKDVTYSEFQREMDLLNEAFAEVMIEGDANGRIFTFPIPTYSITKDFPWEKANLTKIWEMTAKYGTPYFSNFVNSDMDPSDVRSMCCRLRLDNSLIRQKALSFSLETSGKNVEELRHRGGGLFGANPLTGSIGVVTINLSRLGYLSENEDEFLERLSHLMDLAKESLEIKRGVIEDLTHKDLYPYSKYYLSEVYEFTGQYWGNHFATIGIIGMHEACMNLLGEGIETSTGREFAIKVLKFMREKLLEYQKETNNLYNLEATPGEGTSYRLARIDKSKFPDIYTSGKDEPFYTNSTQPPVDYSADPFEVLEHQDELQSLYTGGTVLHIFLGEALEDIANVKEAVKLITSNYRLPYFTLTPTFSICPEHGYIRGNHEKCPSCGKETEIYSRVVGYYRPIKSWNKGKQEEFKMRKPFVLALKETRKIENLRLPGV
ncbi:MAG TPA: ribonucleoside triphosphate reductase [Dictyoglomaceae bacterium]|nr:ribonucleoside triphosphate reductase [Dictyoglomaceae bacterium]HOL39348.1 ribonucleoside triphosphate reductase [Dictyoglomaceae bacterium]HOP94831.1 ribonucleoside triphosphate reductase [Dictyoglomaceae bacterium]HPP15970.1 ribonucleoside triphosphate reductase [Dictyoglomaceae bacterium]HPU43009.1 ribonucleoside triphosphate reductase [Dictyoglomaceae bacterium]